MKELITTLAKTTIDTVTDGSDTQNSFKDDLGGILNAIIGVLGVVAVVVIIIGGVTYMTSSGDASKVKKAKDTILYGIIGLIVAALAFAVVNFVISSVIG